MKERTAKLIHSTTNMAYWLENPDWHTGARLTDAGLTCYRKLNPDMYKRLSRRFFDNDKLIAVSGESVVVKNGEDKVDKFMFRRPGKMAIEAFRGHVNDEIGIMAKYLAGTAMPTAVSIKPAYIFKNPRTQLDAVAQTQKRLDLTQHAKMTTETLISLERGTATDKTARDLELLVTGADRMFDAYGYYPDIANSSGNLRRDTDEGTITLIDVMPFYENGSRLIGDSPANAIILSIQKNLSIYQEFVGQYGS